MTEAIFASEEVEKFTLHDGPAQFTALDTPRAGLPENFFMRYRPRDRGDWYRQDEKLSDLLAYSWHEELLTRLMPSGVLISCRVQGCLRRGVRILSAPVYEGFGPTLACEYLANKYGIEVSKETVRQWMMRAQLWKGKKASIGQVHIWRPRRSRFGELVQWDTSEHDWLEGRGEQLYLIAMIDDATSRLFARFVRHDSTEENMRLLWDCLEKFGRPVAFYTDKASLFQTAEKRKRDEPGVEKDPVEMPPTQIGRALRELGITWIAAHSAQAKGRVERNFQTAQDRLVKARGPHAANHCWRDRHDTTAPVGGRWRWQLPAAMAADSHAPRAWRWPGLVSTTTHG
jgi:transposase-like protein